MFIIIRNKRKLTTKITNSKYLLRPFRYQCQHVTRARGSKHVVQREKRKREK